ncbi:MAG: hypothetical protein SFW66_04130 [Gammaproteobacteria bacterium]|nr:hypothetical protein [Gammaproteobacteria bacterium]
MKNLDLFGWVAFTLLLLSGIDAGLYGIFHFRILELVLGAGLISRVFCILSGVSAAYLIWRALPQGEKAV